MIDLNIVLGEGLSNILFGMTKQDIIDLLGVPDKEYITDYDNHRLQYFDYKIELSLECNDEKLYRLGWIEVHNHNVLFFNKKLIGKKLDNVLQYLEKFIGHYTEIDDYNSFISYTYDKYELELIFEFGVLKNINFGHLFDSNDKPIYKIN